MARQADPGEVSYLDARHPSAYDAGYVVIHFVRGGGLRRESLRITLNNRMVGYTAVETFDRSCGQVWLNYFDGSRVNVSHLKEVVSIDDTLCPSVIGNPIEGDRRFRMPVDGYLYDIFTDLDYMINRIQTDRDFQVLAVIHRPRKRDVEKFQDPRFVFKGYDLMEDATQTSALSNCGGVFDRAYSGEDLSESGLIADYDKARSIRRQLRKCYPNEAHAYCEMWAFWKVKQEYLPRVHKVAVRERTLVKTIPLE